MEDQSTRAGTLSAVLESMQVARENWTGFCLGFSTGHMGWALEVREVESSQLDQNPIPTRENTEPSLDCAFIRQTGYQPEKDRIWFSYYHKGHEKEWSLERPAGLNYERIRGDAKELRIDLEGGRTTLIQLKLVDIPERVGDDNRP